MDKEKAKKLDRLLWKRQLPYIMSFVGIIAFIFLLFFACIHHLQNQKLETVTGKVSSWSRPQGEEGTGSYFIAVILSDGTPISATASRHGRPPKKHEKIKLTKSVSPFGFTTYYWTREEIRNIPTPEKPKLR